MDTLQIFVNAVIFVSVTIRLAPFVVKGRWRIGLLAAWFTAVALTNFILWSSHYEPVEAMARGLAVGLIFVVLTAVYAWLRESFHRRAGRRGLPAS